jgi:hypothetical protein
MTDQQKYPNFTRRMALQSAHHWAESQHDGLIIKRRALKNHGEGCVDSCPKCGGEHATINNEISHWEHIMWSVKFALDAIEPAARIEYEQWTEDTKQ